MLGVGSGDDGYDEHKMIIFSRALGRPETNGWTVLM